MYENELRKMHEFETIANQVICTEDATTQPQAFRRLVQNLENAEFKSYIDSWSRILSKL